MQTIELKGNGQLREGRTELGVPHLDDRVTFVLPLNGPNYHAQVMGAIDSQELLRPTTAQVLSLIDLAQQNPEEPNCANILERFTNKYLWTSTENLSFSKGVIVYDNIDGKMPKTRRGLLELAESDDPRARFVEKGFPTGRMPLADSLNHPYIIAQIGEKMLPVFEKIVKRLDTSKEPKVYVSGLSSTSKNEKRYSAVSGYDDRFDLVGYYLDYIRVGYASGVSGTGGASREK